MALRLGDYVEWGTLLNKGPHNTFGYLKLRGLETPIHFALVGNTEPDLEGKHIRFHPRPPATADPEGDGGAAALPKEQARSIALHQVGATGTMTAARRVKVPDCPPDQLYTRVKARLPVEYEWKRLLYLEWYCQHGRVVLEMVDPTLEVNLAPKKKEEQWLPLPEPEWEEPWSDAAMERAEQTELSITVVRIDEEGNEEIEHQRHRLREDEEENEGSDLERYFAQLYQEVDQCAGIHSANPEVKSERDEIRELELMDNLMENEPGVQLRSLLSKGVFELNLDELSDEEAEQVLKAELSKLALFGIGLHMCEHFDARKALHLLLDKLGREARPFPQLAGTAWVQGYMTSESCPECEAEFEREWEEGKSSFEAGEPD